MAIDSMFTLFAYRSVFLKSAWMQVMARCFPSIAPRLSRFRFKVVNGSRKATARLIRKTGGSDGSAGSGSGGRASTGATAAGGGGAKAAAKTTARSNAGSSNGSPSGAAQYGFQSCDLPLQRSQCRLCAKLVLDDERVGHAASHIITKPFGCSLCQFRTSDYHHLRAHLTKHRLKSSSASPPDKKPNKLTDTNELKQQYFKFCFGD